MVRKAFAERDAAASGSGQPVDDRGHWQQQLAVAVPGENDPLTLLVRGTQLADARPKATPKTPRRPATSSCSTTSPT